jgi:putative tryptophan/tyrosine transport system substrate-binding protein
MDRRAFLGLMSMAVIVPLVAEAQPHSVRIGRLSPLSAEADGSNLNAFRAGLRDLGWVEAKTFTIEARFADGKIERLPTLAAELVRQRVDLILSGASLGALAAKQATTGIPIVMVTTGDPVRDGIVASLARPGGNVTGVTALGQDLNTKRLELIREVVPGVTRLAVLINPASAYTPAFLREKDGAARTLGLDIRTVEVSDPAHLEKAVAAMSGERVAGLMVQTNPLFISHRRRIVDLVARSRIPAVYGDREFVEAGGLMFYGASLAQMYRDAAVYADKILKGAKPGELPVGQPTKFEFVINLKAAKALGLTIPPGLLLRADQLIE